jgi:uncharacterized membrane protein
MPKYLGSPLRVAGLLLLLSGFWVMIPFSEHSHSIGTYVSILGILLVLTDFLSESTGRKERRKRSMEIGLAILVTAVVLTVILDITGVINLYALLRA